MVHREFGRWMPMFWSVLPLPSSGGTDMEVEEIGFFESFKPVSQAAWCHIQGACNVNPPEILIATFR
jgi:hypothetical protein